LRTALAELRDDNAQHEFYLTDIVVIARAHGRNVIAWQAPDAAEFAGINSREDLALMYHWEKKAQGPENQPVGTTQLQLLQCPSAESDRWVTIVEDPANYDYGGKGACGDYTGVREIDTRLVDLGLIDRPSNYQGVLARDYLTRLADITDGTAQTLLLIECAGRPKLWRAGRAVSGIYAPGGAWISGTTTFGQGSTADGTAHPGPCAINCTNDREVYSFHPGGANTAFVDGSTHFLKAGIDIRIFSCLVTRAGGEVATIP
jgi:prepilin-type processing-associated H-X9-DG protein